MPATYDAIGLNYASTRRPDPRIAAMVAEALGPADTILNVGAGAGSYEPAGRTLVAVEPSRAMIAQRAPGSAAVVQGVGEHLPFRDGTFDAVMATLTIHHWPDWRAGIGEMLRVASDRVVLLTFDPRVSHQFWLVQDYFPAISTLPTDSFSFDEVHAAFGGESHVVPVPAECTDGFLAAFWRRPKHYLDPTVRAGMSAFHGLSEHDLHTGLEALESDLQSGAWARRNAQLLAAETFDGGYRLLIRRK
ncbi:MAG: class I SAM-dependent methyltransferase [Dehalococcoidia bacterium]